MSRERERESRIFKNSTSSSSEYIKNYAQTEFIHAQWNTSTRARSSYIHAHTPFERARTARSIIQFLFFGNVSLSISKHTMAHRAIYMRWHLSKKKKRKKKFLFVYFHILALIICGQQYRPEKADLSYIEVYVYTVMSCWPKRTIRPVLCAMGRCQQVDVATS